jgi:tetratricopeptide (TPR) repeat protein
VPDDSWAVGDLVPSAPLPAPGASVTSSGRRIWQGLIPGQVVGGYRLHEPLGAGGAGQVWRAVEPASGREVALKVVDPHLGHEARARLLREGRLTAALRHPGIVRIHAAGEDPSRAGLPGAAWLAYELVPGGRTWRDVGPTLAPADRVRALSAVARALGFAHSKGVVHRDVKATNILVDPSGRPKVADLGLARALAETRLTQTGVLLGTPGAMAPEQLEGRPAGPQADVWAMGALLHEALTGRSPFEGAKTLLALRAAVRAPRLFEGTPPPPGLSPAQRKKVEAVVRRCLDQDATARYADGTALADALVDAGLGDAAERSVSYPGVGARPGEPGSRAPATTRASRTSLWLSALPAGLAAVALVIAASALHSAGGTARADAELRRRTAEVRRAGSGPPAAAALEALLGAGAPAPVFGLAAELQGRLALAEATAPASLDGWRGRLAHARRAVELAAAVGESRLAAGDEARALAAAERASGRALLMLGRAVEAEAAFGRAHAAGAGPGALADRAAALLAAGRPAQAERLAASLLPGASASPAEHAAAPSPAELVPTIVRARLALGDLEGARGALFAARAAQDAAPATSGGSLGPLLALLEAQVVASTGADPRPALEAAVRAWPRHVEPALALARHVALRLGRLDAAVGVARAYMTRTTDVRRQPVTSPRSAQEEADQLELSAVAAAGASLLAVEPGPMPHDLVELPAPWRRAAARWALGEGRREVALVARRVKTAPRPRPGRGPWGQAAEAPVRTVQERGQAGARALARALALAQASDGEVVAQASAALASLGALLGAPPPPEDPVRRAAAAAMLVDAMERQRMGVGRDTAIADLRGVLALDPGDAMARYQVGMLLFDHPESTIVGLRDLVVALDAEPDLLTPLARALRTLASARPFLKGESIDEVVGGLRFVLGDARDRLGEAILRVHLAEYERRPEHGALALDLLDGAIAEDPGVVFAWVLRGSLHLRAGRLDEAARDLAVAADAAPTCAMAVFYEGLLRAARGEAPAVVLATFQRASDLDFSAWEDDGWDASIYPELGRYVTLPGFEVIAGGNRGDAREDAPRRDGR